MSHIASFRAKLGVISHYLDDPLITEIAVNRPGVIWLARQHQRHMFSVAVPELSYGLLHSLAEVTASYTDQETGRTKPVLSAIIPANRSDGVATCDRGGYRIQIILPPAVEQQTIALCIRKPALLDFSLHDYQYQGAFAHVNNGIDGEPYSDARLSALYVAGRWEDFLRGAILAHKNIVISAGTNAGKTTLLNAMLKEIPDCERIVTIEDAREIRPVQPNCLHLLYSRGGQGVAATTAVDLLQAVLRLAPDRAIMGELRGEEAYAYLELLNSGHTGSITTIHADSPELMYDRLAQMVMRFGSPLGKEQIIAYARSLIHVVIQCKRAANGKRYISQISYAGHP
jgi:type IV secretion system protein VirB11